MTLQQLEYTVALDTWRHFVTAAEKCFVTQPTLTMQLKKLEDEIGFLLFDRSRQPLEPTKQGVVVVEQTREILRQVRAMKEMVSAERESTAGTFRLGIIPTLAPYLLPLFLKEFASANPLTTLVIEELLTEEIIRRLHSDSLDLAILAGPLGDESLREVQLFTEPFLVFASDHPLLDSKKIDASTLPHTGMWLLNEGHCFRNQALSVCRVNKHGTRGIQYQSGSIEALKNIVMAQGGFTLVPALAAQDASDKPFVRPFSGKIPGREITLVVHKSFVKEQLLNQMHQTIVASVPADFRTSGKYVRVRWR